MIPFDPPKHRRGQSGAPPETYAFINGPGGAGFMLNMGVTLVPTLDTSTQHPCFPQVFGLNGNGGACIDYGPGFANAVLHDRGAISVFGFIRPTAAGDAGVIISVEDDANSRLFAQVAWDASGALTFTQENGTAGDSTITTAASSCLVNPGDAAYFVASTCPTVIRQAFDPERVLVIRSLTVVNITQGCSVTVSEQGSGFQADSGIVTKQVCIANGGVSALPGFGGHYADVGATRECLGEGYALGVVGDC